MMASSPVLLALLGVVLTGLVKGRAQRLFSLLISFTQLLISSWMLWQTSDGSVFVVQSGGWQAPFGISIILDLTAALFLFVSTFLLLGVHVYSIATIPPQLEKFFHPLWHALGLGVVGSFLTGDLFNLFVWFEVMLMASFALSALGRDRAQWTATIYSLALNLVGSSCFLLGLGFLYNSTGTLNHAHLVLLEGYTEARYIAAFLLLIAFGLKSAAFPLYQWLPASYPGVPIAQLALFAGLLTKVGIYTLIRYFGVGSAMNAITDWSPWIWGLALPTMLLGVLGAASQNSMRRILSFHIISQIGYMLLGIGIGGIMGLSAAIFYVLHHMVVKTNLFLVTGAIESSYGTSDLAQVGGAKKHYPWLAAGFLISALSLVGIPPLSGFWAKIFILGSAIRVGDNWGLSVGLLTSFFTLFSMIKIWSEVFLKKEPTGMSLKKIPLWQMLPIWSFVLWTLWVGFFPGVFANLSQRASEQLLSPIRYQQILSPGKIKR
jgi:multicomponent Na+:H+ antiporter subunit D